MSTVSIVAILGLFAFLVYRGMRNNSGSVCGRGWLAFLMLPIAAAVTYTLFLKTLYRDPTAPAPRKSVAKAPVKKAPLKSVAGQKGKAPSVVSAVKNAPANIKQTVTGAKQAVSTAKSVLNTAKSVKGLQGLAKSYIPKVGVGGALGGNVERTKSLVGYALFLALIQYLISAVVIMAQKPTASKVDVFKKSFVAAGISMIFSLIFIVAVTVVANVIPVVKAIFTVTEKLPFIGPFVNKNFFFTMATSPLNLIGALAAHGIACSLVKEPPPPQK